ncbi:DUF4861 family protein [Cellulophaga tyrosinoxydans]|uniref:DUF4861 domain-containing protein n=1 Tax=Cellulophaga tyrosinoxydans TaxID=504486 RepID=A0A1W2C2Q2_9FLAO|nr:DUF4861 family protein [Cellulophaga tyrosinoxydans]SMC79517.1 protein of unknown function [Cellulophaga tyrosinoxydans]
MKKVSFFIFITAFVFLGACKSRSKLIVRITNSLETPRSFETVEIRKSDLSLRKGINFENLSVQDVASKEILISQLVDENQDGKMDILLFQPKVEAKKSKQFELLVVDESLKPKAEVFCYSRFVPERTDDYAWENNKVAFRTYGPVAQKMIEDGIKGGTLSSGIDAWLKKVEYPIINKWYEKTTTGQGSYHEDTGEGLDNFHVGISRGVGGIAVKKDTSFYVSKNFTSWKTITTGPIRTSFVLEYAAWEANGQPITEKKYISLDYGSNFSKFEIELTGTDAIFAGLTLHEKDGQTTQRNTEGWISYWQPHENSELGTAIIIPNNGLITSELYNTPTKDWSNFYAQIKVLNGKAVYYAGFGWKEAKEFTSQEDWENHLAQFALKVNNPLTVRYN